MGAPRGVLTGVLFGQRLMVSLPGHRRPSGLRGVWGRWGGPEREHAQLAVTAAALHGGTTRKPGRSSPGAGGGGAGAQSRGRCLPEPLLQTYR